MKIGRRVRVHYFGRRPQRSPAASRALTVFWGVLALAYAALLLLVGGGAEPAAKKGRKK